MTITKVKFANEQSHETGWIYIERPDLTDEEIERAYWSLVGKQHEGKIASYLYNFARDILQKASEK